MALQIDEAVFEGEAKFKRIGIGNNATRVVCAVRTRRNAKTDGACQRQRAQQADVIRQVYEALAEKECRRDRAEIFRADALRSGAADVGIDSDCPNRFARRVDTELIFSSERQVGEPTLSRATDGFEVHVGFAEFNAEIPR